MPTLGRLKICKMYATLHDLPILAKGLTDITRKHNLRVRGEM